jgi:cytochrome c oxidase subunit 2
MLGAVDARTVLWGQTLVYTSYALVIICVVAWFSYKLVRGKSPSAVPPPLFYGFVAFLVVTGVTLHIVTYNTIPWSAQDLHRASATPDQVVQVGVADHEFSLPSNPITISCDQDVLFDVTSSDLTYGFGLFRPDESMLFQMQVVPGHENQLLWTFRESGVYSIRSTEYSGPEGYRMVVPDSVHVVDCAEQDPYAQVGEGSAA